MKKCPLCLTEAIESHSYCSKCRYPLTPPDVPGDGSISILEQIRQGWVSLLLIIGFIGGSVILVRAIDWRSLNLMLHGETMTAEEKSLDKQSVTERLARRKVSRGRNQVAGSAVNATQVAANQEGSRPQSAPATDLAVASSSGAAAVERTPNRANLADDQSVEIEQFEAPPTDQTGIVTIKSQATARVYIDGQYSGVTPRTVNLNAGEHQVRLVSDGYLEWNDRIQVRSRKQTGVLASMTRNE